MATKFELYAEDKKNRIIVDIQHIRFPDHYHRFLHYHCAALLDQVVNLKDYQPKLKVFTLVVLTSGDRHKEDISIIDFDPKNLVDESHYTLSEIQQIFDFIEKVTSQERALMFDEHSMEEVKKKLRKI